MRQINGERLQDCLRELEGKLVIVEGKKDRKALKSLGVKNIMQLGGMPLAEFALHVSKSQSTPKDNKREEAVILTDFDSEGKELAAKLERLLKRHKVLVNTRIRKRFTQFGKGCIEAFKEGDIHGEIGSNVNKVRRKGLDEGQRCGREA